MSDLAAHPHAPGVVPLLLARDVLYATRLDARIREASKAARSLDDVLRALVRDAATKSGRLPEATFHDKVAAEIGARGKEDFDAFVVRPTKTAMPGDSLGACFELGEASYDIVYAGLDVAATRDARRVVGFDSNGPTSKASSKAGVRATDTVVSIEDVLDAATPITVEVERDRKMVKIAFEPKSRVRRGPSFRRRAGLSDDACRKLALRK